MNDKKIRVLIGKPGLDGHDHGGKIVVRALMDAGFDVTYTGLRKTPEEIVQAAIDARADVIGLSSMAGSHIPFCRIVLQILQLRLFSQIIDSIDTDSQANWFYVQHHTL